jgi:hypothetical protein
MALGVFGFGPAHADNLVWMFGQDEASAFVGVVDSKAQAEPEADYPFYMTCAAGGDESTVVSSVDAKALGEAIAKGDVPGFSFVLDGKGEPEDGNYAAELRYEQMNGVWQYVVDGADYDLLLTATKSIAIHGQGVALDLPEADMLASLQQFKSACDALFADDGEGGGDDDGGAEQSPPAQ